MIDAVTMPMTSQGAARRLVIALISFLTLVDLFATQAILPSLARAYDVAPGTIGPAVNICTLGMAIAGVVVAIFNHRIPRRAGVSVSLALLALPTAGLALMPDLTTFTILRFAQGLCMSTAFSLTIAYLAETGSAKETAGALAAYVTGNVASNLFGRLVSAAVADHLGLAANFVLFAGLNLAGAALAYAALNRMAPMNAGAPPIAWRAILANQALLAGFAIGFLILFAFIGTFTYVNFVLIAPPLNLTPMQVGFVYVVFAPAILATPFAGRAAERLGGARTIALSLGLAALAAPLLLAPSTALVLLGMASIALGTFFAQGTATGMVARAAGPQRGTAAGLYLAAYYAGGLAGSLVLGRLFDSHGWPATVAAIVGALAAGVAMTRLLDGNRSTAMTVM